MTEVMKPPREPIETTLVWHDPNKTPPRFETPILVALGSWQDQGYGFHAHTTIKTVSIMEMDADSDVSQGEEMVTDVLSGDAKWDDLQFTMHDEDGEEISDCYSDSIMWWAEIPSLPQRRN